MDNHEAAESREDVRTHPVTWTEEEGRTPITPKSMIDEEGEGQVAESLGSLPAGGGR